MLMIYILNYYNNLLTNEFTIHFLISVYQILATQALIAFVYIVYIIIKEKLYYKLYPLLK